MLKNIMENQPKQNKDNKALRPGWLKRQLKQAEKDWKSLPKWYREGTEALRKTYEEQK